MSLRWKLLLAVQAALVLATLFAWGGAALVGWDVGSPLHLAAWTAMLVACLWCAVVHVHRHHVRKPTQIIVDVAARLAAGEEVELQNGHDEFGGIARAVQALAEHAALSREELERQVEERTSDLRAVLAEAFERSRIAEEVNKKLADLDRRRSAFLSNVSHELRTPLNSTLGFLELLIDGLYEDDTEMREYLENARFCASHLLQLVTDILSATQIEVGKIRIEPTALHPADVVNDVFRMMEFHTRGNHVRLKMEIDGSAIVLADPVKLRQILVNLVGNAIKFTERGEIVVRARAVGGCVRFEVEDTGAGIAAEHLEKIFEKFHQIENPLTRAHGGTGMGLAICRQLVGLMDGEIGADSPGLGKGALLWFTLPVPVPVESGA